VIRSDHVVLDTDVASLSLKRRLPASLLRRMIGKQPCITFVTLGELTKWVELRNWGVKNRAVLAQWLQGVVVLPYGDDVAVRWGRISAAAIRRGRARPANDMWIAACCLTEDFPLVTFNVKDFEDFAHYEGMAILTS
jgi:predicted nucleic acid-binding protein